MGWWNGEREHWDVLAMVDDMNEEPLEIEAEDLESIDKYLEDQEKAADERYERFEEDQLRQEK